MGRNEYSWIIISYGYEKGHYAYVYIELSNHTIKSVKKEGDYSATNTVERIVVYTSYQPSRMRLSDVGYL